MDEEETIESLKSERTSLKSSVTRLSRRLKLACDSGFDNISTTYKQLEDEYCDFVETDERYRVLAAVPGNEDFLTVNGLDLDQYSSQVKSTFGGARAAYKAHVATLGPPQAAPVASSSVVAPPGAVGGSVTATSKSYRFKKRDLPRFSGKRSDWPTFKTEWTLVVLPEITDPIQRATDLLSVCRNGFCGQAWRCCCRLRAEMSKIWNPRIGIFICCMNRGL